MHRIPGLRELIIAVINAALVRFKCHSLCSCAVLITWSAILCCITSIFHNQTTIKKMTAYFCVKDIAMFCSLCQNLDLDALCSSEGLQHHVTWEALLVSAKEGCTLCELIANAPLWLPEVVDALDYTPSSGIRQTQIIGKYVMGNPPGIIRFWQPFLQYRKASRSVALKIYATEGAVTSTLLILLKCSCLTGDPLSRMFGLRPLPRSSRSAATFEVASTWLANCLKTHESCSVNVHASLPTRVIDIGCDETPARLFITQGSRGEWLTLSHCWGDCTDGSTTTQNVHSRQDNLHIDTLPRSFQDAIYITKKLGYRFLWINSICIIQDSKPDWDYECLQMREYYSLSTLTIAAVAAKSSQEGIFASADKH